MLFVSVGVSFPAARTAALLQSGLTMCLPSSWSAVRGFRRSGAGDSGEWEVGGAAGLGLGGGFLIMHAQVGVWMVYFVVCNMRRRVHVNFIQQVLCCAVLSSAWAVSFSTAV